MNIFRLTRDAPLDRKYLRTCAVYKLLKRQRIGFKCALKLLAERHGKENMRPLVELWRAGPIKDMLP